MASHARKLVPTVALLCAVTFLAAGCGSDYSSSDDQTDVATTPAKTSQSYEAFQLPSKNIACQVLKPAYARCEVKKKTFSPPVKPASCTLDWGTSVAVQGKGPGKFICHGDTVVVPDAPVLEYGESSAVGSVVCDSSEAGIECRNTNTGHGFFLAREDYRTF
ncbi:MAG: hypothetical protein JJE13_06865 [Thermoleophilia bacterium]|nr:hypothetical protein [Thermoleophilia bacterium]